MIIEAEADDKSLLFLFKSLTIPNSKIKSLPEIPMVAGQVLDLNGFKEAQKENYKKNIEYMRTMAQRYNGSVNLRPEKEEYLIRYLEYFE